MGHLVNPISFRLGYTQFWKSRWFILGNRTKYLQNLREDLITFKYIDCFFEFYKFLKKFDNNFLERELKKKEYLRPSQLKKFKLKQYILIKFFNSLSLLFSHLFINRSSSNIFFLLHIYDASLEYLTDHEFFF